MTRCCRGSQGEQHATWVCSQPISPDDRKERAMATDLTLYLDNEPGQLARVGDLLGQAGANIEGLCAVGSGGGQAEVHILVRDPTPAFEALQRAGVKIASEEE